MNLSLKMEQKQYTRREGLIAIAGGVLSIAKPPLSFAKPSFHEVLHPSIQFRESTNRKGENTDLFPDSFKRCIIDYNGKTVASFFSIEQHSQKAKIFFTPNNSISPLVPQNIISASNSVFVFAGPFTNKQGKIAGKAYFQGKSVGEDEWENSFSGILLIDENGHPQIVNIPEAQKTAFLQMVERKELSFFQQYPLIHNGTQTDISKKLTQKENKWRFFVRRKDGTHGVLDFSHRDITLNQAIHIAIQSDIEEALYLDMEASSLGFYKAKDGVFPFYDSQYKDALSIYSPGGYIVGSRG